MSEDIDIFFIPIAPQTARRCAIETCRKLLAQSNKGELCFACQEKERQRVLDGAADFAGPAPTRMAFQRTVASAPVLEPKPKRSPPTMPGNCHRCDKPRHYGPCKGMPRGSYLTRRAQPIESRLPAVPATVVEIIPAEEPREKIDVQKETGAPAKKKPSNQLDVLESETIAWADVPAYAKPAQARTGRLGELLNKLLALDAAGRGEGEKVKNRSMIHAGSTIRHLRKKAKQLGREIEHRRGGEDLTTVYMRLKPKEA